MPYHNNFNMYEKKKKSLRQKKKIKKNGRLVHSKQNPIGSYLKN